MGYAKGTGSQSNLLTAMTREEAHKLLDVTLDQLGEHFDAVQIHATWMDDGNGTSAVHRGSGNFYARESMAREFVWQNRSEDAAKFTAQEIRKNEDPD